MQVGPVLRKSKIENFYLLCPLPWLIIFFMLEPEETIFIILRVSANCFSNLLTSWTEVPDPLAILFRLDPSIRAASAVPPSSWSR